MHKPSLFVPLIILAIASACTTDDGGPAPEVGAQVRMSAKVQSDIAGLASIELRLTPALECGNSEPAENAQPFVYGVDIEAMLHPDGTPFDAATDFTHLLAETAFEGVIPGCYDVVAAPLDQAGEPLESCYPTSVTIELEENGAAVVDLPIQCGDVPRDPLDIMANNNPPTIDSMTAEPMVSSCEATTVCVSARDADGDALIFEWPQPAGVEEGSPRSPWPTITRHVINPDGSVEQCIAVQVREPGSYDIGVTVFDALRNDIPGLPPIKVETWFGGESRVSESVTIDATLGCDATGRSAVILLTLGNDPGMATTDARKLIDNTVRWLNFEGPEVPTVLVVLDDNHHGEDWQDGEFVRNQISDLGYGVEYMVEPSQGLDFSGLEAYDMVWFVNPGYEMDDAATHTALLRYRALGGGVVLQGDDIARFRGAPDFMEPLTYLAWKSNGTNACGILTDNNQGRNYTVAFDIPTADPHPMAEGLELLSFEYGNDIDLTRPLDKGERVLAWASFDNGACEVRTPAIVALDPEVLLSWD